MNCPECKAELPPDWCGHDDVYARSARTVLSTVPGAILEMDAEIARLTDELSGCNSGVLDLQAEIARLRRIEEAARDIVSGRHGSTYHDVGSIVGALRDALDGGER